jgi:hypothetical protein
MNLTLRQMNALVARANERLKAMHGNPEDH